MTAKSTDELNNVLGSTHVSDVSHFLKENSESMQTNEKAFSFYMKDLFSQKGLSQQEVFLKSDIPEKYGYKLLSGEKRTRQRDIIVRLCYAAEFTLDETQKALRMYGMPELYVKMQRDAVLMVCFNDRPGSVLDVNAVLKKNGLEPLRSSGTQE